jgi:hypothetical protein
MNSLQQAQLLDKVVFSIVASAMLVSLIAITWYFITHKEDDQS